ncbi:hypothetical protein [Rhizorhapis sp. SPR117]|uniref:hypothetical protein n=1 Tax=Rhizorhapis sp. SPR117 TaxID=2912611 RepID=UPI001F25BFB2|nr:hypothetical protein [Rhizorhapis sp. SPR117]
MIALLNASDQLIEIGQGGAGFVSQLRMFFFHGSKCAIRRGLKRLNAAKRALYTANGDDYSVV